MKVDNQPSFAEMMAVDEVTFQKKMGGGDDAEI